MKTECTFFRCHRARLVLFIALFLPTLAIAAMDSTLEIGLAVRDVTPELPIRLAGYAGRKRPADKLDHPLLAQALALKNPTGERFVFVALDTCIVGRAFIQPVLEQCAEKFQLGPGTVAVVCSHTHSAPVLEASLTDMVQPTAEEREHIARYSRLLQSRLVEVVGAALADCQLTLLERGLSRATFAVNRRLYDGDHVRLTDNPDGPVDWDVPVLRVKATNGAVRAVVFGYACHGTCIRGGDDWYVVCGEYMGYARQQLEALQPGAMAMFLTGMGADSDPTPRGGLLETKRHGLELAGAVMGALNRPMQPVRGGFKLAYDEVELPLKTPPTQEQLEKDASGQDVYVKLRAENYLKLLKAGQPLPESVKLPLAALRLGDDLTFVLMGGEVVVDYSRRIKRVYAADHPWTIGYAYHVPCYIPTTRLIKEGGYEVDSSMIYYGFYGPFRVGIEDIVFKRLEGMMDTLRAKP